MDDGDMPTRDEWIEEQANKRGPVQQKPQHGEAHILQGKNNR